MPERNWQYLRDRLGITGLTRIATSIHDHVHRQESRMAKLSDELTDLSRRLDAVRDAQTTSNANTRSALERLETEVQALRDGDLTAEQQARVDAIKQATDELRAAAESADDGYEPPQVEQSPFPPTPEGQPDPGTAEDTAVRRGRA